jgi:hypothetical protein
MKTYERPEFAIFRKGIDKVFPQMSLADLLLLISTMAETEKDSTFVYHPAWGKWKPVKDVSELTSASFSFQRNVKAPAPPVNTQPSVGPSAAARAAPVTNQESHQRNPTSPSNEEYIVPPHIELDLETPYFPNFKAKISRINFPYILLNSDCPLPTGKEFGIQIRNENYIFDLKAQIINPERRKILMLSPGPNVAYFEELINIFKNKS